MAKIGNGTGHEEITFAKRERDESSARVLRSIEFFRKALLHDELRPADL